MSSLQELELLSPAKNADIGIEAISHGADAVYIGGPSFGARANAGNSLEDLERLVKYAHQYRARVYLTLNTLLKDKELEKALELAHNAWNIGIDALIVQDMGLLMCDLPPIQLHASTQCDIRTAEKAKFLENVGFSQIVLARELELSQIKAIYDSLEKARIEFFIHGALCVSYSGQCYASQVLKNRSANRGECSQVCRLPFDVYDEEGKVLGLNEHVLSLKDNNQSANLPALIEAGVRSFKIEGRYKDAAYVKNTTAHYRRLLDQFLSRNPSFAKSSEGKIEFFFAPDVNNAFNRGGTDYFVNGRQADIACFNSPKKTGDIIGKVVKIDNFSITVRSKHEFNNGDGLTFWNDKDELSGFLVNRAEKVPDATNLWTLHTREHTGRISGLSVGMELMRNKDAAWLKKMNATTSLRKVPIKIEAKFSDDSLTVCASDKDGNVSTVSVPNNFDEAKNRENTLSQIKKSLGKLGNTIFDSDEISVEGDTIRFLPASAVNSLRRTVIEDLENKRLTSFSKLPKAQAKEPGASFAENSMLDYRGNVLNQKAREFYEKHGFKIVETALEDGHKNPQAELMRCKHCIRYSLNLCPKEARKRGEKIKPTPLKLVCGKTVLIAKFHCKPCEMTISLPNEV